MAMIANSNAITQPAPLTSRISSTSVAAATCGIGRSAGVTAGSSRSSSTTARLAASVTSKVTPVTS
jgi:hypothetical protein